MGNYKLTGYEQETIINYNYLESECTVDSADPRIIKKLMQLSKEFPDTYKIIKETNCSKTFTFPKKLIQFKKPSTRVYTDEQKAAMKKRLESYRKSKADT